MRISAKARYGLFSLVCMAERHNSGECVTIAFLSEKLNISKIYLEQVFALLKRGGIVASTKGASGGYKLAKDPSKITAFDALNATENALFEPYSGGDCADSGVENAVKTLVFDSLDKTIEQTLKALTLADLAAEAVTRGGYMFYL